MKSKNSSLNKPILIVTGIILFAGGASEKSFILVVVGIVCFLLGVIDPKKINTTSTDIKSGTTQNMPENTITIKSADLNTFTQHKSVERTDYCPICKEHSSNGYCTKCGYRFNK